MTQQSLIMVRFSQVCRIGQLTISKGIIIGTDIIKDVSLIRVAYLYPFNGEGYVALDKEVSHRIFYYDTNDQCFEKKLVRSIFVHLIQLFAFRDVENSKQVSLQLLAKLESNNLQKLI